MPNICPVKFMIRLSNKSSQPWIYGWNHILFGDEILMMFKMIMILKK